MFDLTLPTPVELAFEPINLCNAKCFCCPYTYLEKDKEYRGKRMTAEQIDTLLSQYAAGLKKHGIPPMKATVQPWRYSDPLVCKDLELVFELCKKHDLLVILTTNAVSFSEAKCDVMMKYIDNLDNIYISIIGHNKEEIKSMMGIDWDVTQARLKMVRDKYPSLSKLMRIGIKHQDQEPSKKRATAVVNKVQQLTLGKVKIKRNWLENRLSSNDFDPDNYDLKISEKQFVQGCSMVHGKILRRLEVMVDGTAVLCCDDATKQTNFGNVFEIGVEGVWKNLTEYHKLIYSQEFSEGKLNMMCNTCSRARFKWDDDRNNDIRQENAKYLRA